MIIKLAAVFTAIIASFVMDGFNAPARADTSTTKVLSGQYQVSGGSIGCTDLVRTKVVIAFGGRFERAPNIGLQTTTGDANDRLVAELISTSDDSFTVALTSYGIHDHQICANAFLRWTASI